MNNTYNINLAKKDALQRAIGASISWIAICSIILYCLFVYTGIFPTPSTIEISWISFGVCLLCLFIIKLNKNIATFGLTSVLLIYMMCTQFGLGTIFYILGPEYVSKYSVYTLMFLFSDQYVKAVVLALLAIMTYTIATSIGTTKGGSINKRLDKSADETRYIEAKYVVRTGYLFLVIVFLYLLYQLATGQISLSMNYSSYREGVVDTNDLYHYILIMYSVGIAFIISAGNRKHIKNGFLLYACSAIVFFLTGNKGEVLYAVLACIGASQYRGYKIKPSLILALSSVLFVVIPFITEARKSNVLESLNKIGFSLTDAFVEMGMQLRLNIYILEQFVDGSRNFLNGYSYINPLMNIMDNLVPFVSLRMASPEDFNFKELFPGYGFNQVAESYANFGLIGVLGFFFIMGFIISRIESKNMDVLSLAYFTSIVSVLINVTRNSFAFVPGQILLLTILYFAIKIISKRKTTHTST